MAVRIRLARLGTKKRVHQRIVVIDSRRARDSKYIEQIGIYEPRQNPAVVRVDKERAQYWLSKGAKPSETVRVLLRKQGIS